MIFFHPIGSSSNETLSQSAVPQQIRQIVDLWNVLCVCEELRATNWEVLKVLERQVTECLYKDPPDIMKAESLTAKAMLLIDGDLDL